MIFTSVALQVSFARDTHFLASMLLSQLDSSLSRRLKSQYPSTFTDSTLVHLLTVP
jgi:Mor family transcriptional regulator